MSKSNLQLEPTNTVNKGTLISKSLHKSAPYDLWTYEIEIIESDTISEAIVTIYELLASRLDKFEELCLHHEVMLNLYLQSDYAQLGFELSQKAIDCLKKLNIKVDFHILSWGGV
ncbi:DUF4279 domain-containing protein [Marinicrinis sediminis]|uniref:DUF4279 domain-containing protein n=1 Tax=Marinicrinis sediminis TaxID=1652465 RepID=A0ABW5R9Z6_9BACL